MWPCLAFLPAQGGNDRHFRKSGFWAQISQINLTDLRNPSDLAGLTGLTGRINLIDLIDRGGVSSLTGLSTPRCDQVHVPGFTLPSSTLFAESRKQETLRQRAQIPNPPTE